MAPVVAGFAEGHDEEGAHFGGDAGAGVVAAEPLAGFGGELVGGQNQGAVFAAQFLDQGFGGAVEGEAVGEAVGGVVGDVGGDLGDGGVGRPGDEGNHLGLEELGEGLDGEGFEAIGVFFALEVTQAPLEALGEDALVLDLALDLALLEHGAQLVGQTAKEVLFARTPGAGSFVGDEEEAVEVGGGVGVADHEGLDLGGEEGGAPGHEFEVVGPVFDAEAAAVLFDLAAIEVVEAIEAIVEAFATSGGLVLEGDLEVALIAIELEQEQAFGLESLEEFFGGVVQGVLPVVVAVDGATELGEDGLVGFGLEAVLFNVAEGGQHGSELADALEEAFVFEGPEAFGQAFSGDKAQELILETNGGDQEGLDLHAFEQVAGNFAVQGAVGVADADEAVLVEGLVEQGTVGDGNLGGVALATAAEGGGLFDDALPEVAGFGLEPVEAGAGGADEGVAFGDEEVEAVLEAGDVA